MQFYRDGLTIEADGPPRVVQRNGHVCEVFKTADGDMWFVTLEGTHFCAHGESFHDAVVAAKEKQNPGAGKADAIERIQKSGLVSLTDFCLATGACRAGATAWAKEEGISVKTELKVADVLKRLDKSSSRSWGETLREELDHERIN
jgi:hypothetical protein